MLKFPMSIVRLFSLEASAPLDFHLFLSHTQSQIKAVVFDSYEEEEEEVGKMK